MGRTGGEAGTEGERRRGGGGGEGIRRGGGGGGEGGKFILARR